MPIYEYQCKACGKIFEQLVWNVSEDDTITCPDCKNSDCQRILSSCSTLGSKKGSLASIGSSCSTTSRGFS